MSAPKFRHKPWYTPKHLVTFPEPKRVFDGFCLLKITSNFLQNSMIRSAKPCLWDLQVLKLGNPLAVGYFQLPRVMWWSHYETIPGGLILPYPIELIIYSWFTTLTDNHQQTQIPSTDNHIDWNHQLTHLAFLFPAFGLHNLALECVSKPLRLFNWNAPALVPLISRSASAMKLSCPPGSRPHKRTSERIGTKRPWEQPTIQDGKW